MRPDGCIDDYVRFDVPALISHALTHSAARRIYHYQVGSVPFQKQGWIRPVYFTILLTHTILAVTIVPLVLVTVTRALRGRFDRHARLARWTLPIWFYVSVTGVVIYVMLYRM